jgi:hypothetical protein
MNKKIIIGVTILALSIIGIFGTLDFSTTESDENQGTRSVVVSDENQGKNFSLNLNENISMGDG